jgi:tetratricopeptide (TPR) repeat protein
MRVRGASIITMSKVGLFVAAIVVGGSSASAGTGCNKAAVDAQKLAKHAEMIQGEDPKSAAEEYKQASSMDPTNHRILQKLATLYEKQKDWQNAAETWAKAAGADPTKGSDDFASYHFQRGYDLFQLAKKDPAHPNEAFQKAIDPLKKAAQKDPNLADAWYYLGKCQYETDDEQGALESWTKAIETKANDLAYYVDLANLYLDLGFPEQGLQVSQEGQKMAPQAKFNNEDQRNEAANTLYNLVLDEARAYEILNKPDDKIKALEKARNVPNPKNLAREAEYQLAIAYNDKGLPQDACSALTNYLKSPQGKTPESMENHRDADTKKFQWKCPGQ